jgi:hypothetical protein
MKQLCFSMLLACAACSGSTSTIELSNPEIELDAFSGRPNPRWRLTSTEQRTLQDKLSDLPATMRTRVPAGQLGYRGFYIHDQKVRIQIAADLIVVSRADSAHRIFEDRHGAEQFLLTLAKQRGYGAVISPD